ncbi:hypothetical protein YC2023_045129 [Brassica napus]
MLRGLLDVPWQKAVMIDDVKNRCHEGIRLSENNKNTIALREPPAGGEWSSMLSPDAFEHRREK